MSAFVVSRHRPFFAVLGVIFATSDDMAKKNTRRSRGERVRRGGLTKEGVRKADARNRPPKKEKRNKIHVSLFVDGEDVTLIDEFNTPAEAIAACREFLDKHAPQPS